MTEKKCTKCGKEFPATPEYFHRDVGTKDGLKYWCKKCTNEYVRNYYKKKKKVNKTFSRVKEYINEIKEARKIVLTKNKESRIMGITTVNINKLKENVELLNKIRDAHLHRAEEVQTNIDEIREYLKELTKYVEKINQ